MRQEFAPQVSKAVAARRRRAREERYAEGLMPLRGNFTDRSAVARAAQRWLDEHPAESFGA